MAECRTDDGEIRAALRIEGPAGCGKTFIALMSVIEELQQVPSSSCASTYSSPLDRQDPFASRRKGIDRGAARAAQPRQERARPSACAPFEMAESTSTPSMPSTATRSSSSMMRTSSTRAPTPRSANVSRSSRAARACCCLTERRGRRGRRQTIRAHVVRFTRGGAQQRAHHGGGRRLFEQRAEGAADEPPSVGGCAGQVDLDLKDATYVQKTVEALEHIVTTSAGFGLIDRVAILVDGRLYNPEFEAKLTAAIASRRCLLGGWRRPQLRVDSRRDRSPSAISTDEQGRAGLRRRAVQTRRL